MKKEKLILVMLFVVLLITINLQAKTGISAKPSTFGPGLGFRYWSNENIGFGINALPSWQFDDFIGRARIMYSFMNSGSSRFYGLLTGGYMTVNEKDEGVEYSVSMPTGAAGVGYEWFLKRSKRHGLAIELGYQIGSADYEITVDLYNGQEMTIEDTYKVIPLYLGLDYTIYF